MARLRTAPCLLAGLLALGGCSRVSNPEPSRLYDGRYAGTRHSNLPEACGTAAARGRAVADIRGGAFSMELFNPGTRLSGTVGSDGALRASGLWQSPRGFHNFTVLQGSVRDGRLTGTASDSRCVTELALQRAGR